MMKKMMVKCALLGVAALMAAACFTDQDYSSQYDYQVLVQFEPDADYDWEVFLKTFFNEGKDTVAFHENFSFSPINGEFNCPIYHFAKVSETDGFQGGMVMAIGKDADASADRKPSRFAVFDEKGGYKESRGYAVYHDTTGFLMPEHTIQISIPNADSFCEIQGMYVQNVQAVYQAAKYGVGLAGGPFTEDDYLILTVTGFKASAQTGQKEVKLVDGTNAIKEWKEVDLSALGKVDAVDFHLASSRPDLPLYCCVDAMAYHIIIKF